MATQSWGSLQANGCASRFPYNVECVLVLKTK